MKPGGDEKPSEIPAVQPTYIPSMKIPPSLAVLGLFAGSMIPLSAGEMLPTTESVHDLQFPDLASSWDEGMPLGNATVGAIIWQKGNCLRFALDRTDLWDLRPTEFVESDIFRFSWVREHVLNNDYGIVQQKLDAPYNALPGPSKIPGAALEFDISSLGKVKQSHLYLKDAVCEVTWENGTSMQSFVHATRPVGWFAFDNVPEDFVPRLVPPAYRKGESASHDNSHAGADLDRLGYKQGRVAVTGNTADYHQQGWGDFSYDVSIRWKREGKRLTGVWAVTSSLSKDQASNLCRQAMAEPGSQLYATHQDWWNTFWKKSSVSLPDPVLEKQYYNEIYKLGSTTRSNSYPISLQAVWTADNGKLPPWKGDYHHDLNTQLSYWPCYTGNYLDEGLGYLNTLWNQRQTHKQYTKRYFEKDGLNAPGVCTLTGVPMGGWVQYSCSPTVSAWLAQHFYKHWQYSRDKKFLKERAYPYLKDVATFLEQFSTVENGVRKLPLSSSPEIHDNSINAWFRDTTNYDLALMRFAFKASAELATELGLNNDAAHWKKLEGQLPSFAVDDGQALAFAPGKPYRGSHRHFSHAMAIHPLGLLDWDRGEQDRQIIRSTIAGLDQYGPGAWCGYSYSWLGNMKARARDGEGAARALRDFAQCFCLRNTFHANGDQTGSGKSGFTYRPFTLEGNFAFAAGVQEMLLQSHSGTIRVFPAIPADWKDVRFGTLRANGAFLVSAERRQGEVGHVSIYSEQGGKLRLENPFPGKTPDTHGKPFREENGILIMNTRPGETISLSAPPTAGRAVK